MDVWRIYRVGTQLANKGYPIYLPPDTLTTMEPIIRGLGGTLAAPDLHVVSGYLDSDATAEAFALYAAMLSDLTGGTGEAGVERTFGMLRASQMLVGPGIAPIPTSVEGVRHNNALMTGLAISKDSRQQELACAYMKYLAGDTSDDAMELRRDRVTIPCTCRSGAWLSCSDMRTRRRQEPILSSGRRSSRCRRPSSLRYGSDAAALQKNVFVHLA